MNGPGDTEPVVGLEQRNEGRVANYIILVAKVP